MAEGNMILAFCSFSGTLCGRIAVFTFLSKRMQSQSYRDCRGFFLGNLWELTMLELCIFHIFRRLALRCDFGN